VTSPTPTPLATPPARPAPAGGRLAERRLYLCTPDRPDLEGFVSACIAGGVDLVQLREKDLEARPLLARARLLARVCRDHGVPFILNDRPDLALECGADGVHVGQDDAPAGLARRILGATGLVGLSTHEPAQLVAALAEPEPADYLSAGPVVPTPTKPGRPGTGTGYLQEAADRCGAAGVPWFVTGGVTPETVPGLARAGAERFVVVRYLTGSNEPRDAARRLRHAIDAALARPPQSGGAGPSAGL
jgi:thiamine-phosphate pyrophosphorylase